MLAIVVAYAVFQLFEGPVADAWYANRQHQLAPRAATLQANPRPGDPIAIMQIPRLGLSLVVAQGDSPQQLRSGPGHRVGTPQPGDVGNSVVLGHRAGWGGPLHDLDQLKAGDHIVVQVAGPPPDFVPVNGVFEVKTIRPASADDVTIFAPSTDRRLTIVTGTGGQFSDRRLVLTAVSGPEGKLLAPGAGRRRDDVGRLAYGATARLLAVACFALAGCADRGPAAPLPALRRSASWSVRSCCSVSLGLLLDIDARVAAPAMIR